MTAYAKGRKYENEVAKIHEDAGLPARRVYLSGRQDIVDADAIREAIDWQDPIGSLYRVDAMLPNDSPGDVVVCDQYQVEVKYRRNFSGFKSVYRWVVPNEVTALRRSGLYAMSMRKWLEVVREAVDAGKTLQRICRRETRTILSVSESVTLQKWIDGCDVLACRGPREDWLVFVPMEPTE